MASLFQEFLALGEVAGRQAVERWPGLRKSIGRRARKPPAAPVPIDLAQIRERILALGLAPGRDLLVHSTFQNLRRVQARLDEWVPFLRDLIGPHATLLMPSHPVLGEKDGLPLYDVARSPSSVGMLTERMRRTAGVLRSPFPVAPILALGPHAETYTADFRASSGGLAYGKGSPYHLLTEARGQALYLGIDFIRTVTLEHVAFDLLGHDHPVRDYHVEKTFLVRHEGREERWRVRDHRKEVERRLATFAFRSMILGSGTVRESKQGGLALSVMDAKAFVDWHLPLARRRGWPYWGYLPRRAAA